MSNPDSSQIDRVILDALKADATLAGLVPGGVWFGIPPPGLRVFVLVTVDQSTDDGVFQHRRLESVRYIAQAVGLSTDTSLGAMKDAAERIDNVLDGDTPIATPTGYASIDCVRDERLADSVVDEVDKSLSWHHYGGYYMVTCAWPD